MSIVPTAHADHQKIRQLIWQRGYSQADFARLIGRPARTIYGLLNDRPPQSSVALIRQVARGLRVRPSDISDWTGDDDIDAEAKVPA